MTTLELASGGNVARSNLFTRKYSLIQVLKTGVLGFSFFIFLIYAILQMASSHAFITDKVYSSPSLLQIHQFSSSALASYSASNDLTYFICFIGSILLLCLVDVFDSVFIARINPKKLPRLLLASLLETAGIQLCVLVIAGFLGALLILSLKIGNVESLITGSSHVVSAPDTVNNWIVQNLKVHSDLNVNFGDDKTNYYIEKDLNNKQVYFSVKSTEDTIKVQRLNK